MKKSEAIAALIRQGDHVAQNYRRVYEGVNADDPPYSADAWDALVRNVRRPAVKPVLSAKDKRITELEAQVAVLLGKGDEMAFSFRSMVGYEPLSASSWRTLAAGVRGV